MIERILKRKALSIASLLLSMQSAGVYAQVPEEFEELIQPLHMKTRLIVNDTDITEVWANVGYNNATLDREEAKTLRRFLSSLYIKANVIDQVINELLSGVTSSNLCLGARDTCIIKNTEKLQYIIMKDKEVIRLTVPSELMALQSDKQRYIDNTIDQNALLMHHKLNMNAGSDNNPTLFYQNATTLGAFGGYFYSDANIKSNQEISLNLNGNIYFDQINYNYAIEDKRLRAGYRTSTVDDYWNSTAILDSNGRKNALTVDFGSSNDLTFKSRASGQRHYFSVPSSGRLIVTRDNGEPVLEKNVSAGQNYISYNELPEGIHLLNIKVVSGDQVLYNENKKIFNNSGYDILTGSFDYQLSIGLLYEKDVTANNHIDDDFNNKNFAEVSIATRLADPLLMAVSVFNTSEDYFAKAAVQYDSTQNLSANILLGTFNNNSSYSQLDVTLGNLSLSYSQFNDEGDPNQFSLSNYLYGFGSFTEQSASYSQPLFSGNMYLNYSNYQSENGASIYEDTKDELYDNYKSYMVGYSFYGFLRSTIDINAGYSTYKESLSGSENEDWSVALSFSIQLATQTSLNISATSRDSYNYSRATVGHTFRDDKELSVNGEAGLSYSSGSSESGNVTAETMLSAGFNNDHFSGSSYAYVDSDNTYNTYADLSISTLFVGDQIYTTDKQSDSYLIIDNQRLQGQPVSEENDDKFYSIASLKSNSDWAGRTPLDRDTIVYPIESYASTGLS